jgi:membrane-bound lytic murein transglycosylase D
MDKLISISLLIFFIFSPLKASFDDKLNIKNNFKILDDLNINQDYLLDKKLQILYNRYLKTNTTAFLEKLNNAYYLIPQIKKILKENNIPQTLLYMVMAESNFILDASSRQKAVGLWQIIPQTGKKFGLKIDEYVDERLDILKSTKTAINYLKYLHKKFGKWYIAVFAYNCGEARVIEGITRATLDMYCKDYECKKDDTILQYRDTIRKYQVKKVSYSQLYKIYKKMKQTKYKPNINKLLKEQTIVSRQYIPSESRQYIRKIISFAMMGNHFGILKNNSYLLNRGICEPFVKVKVKGGLLLKNIALVMNLTKDELKSINLHIKEDIIPPQKNSYDIYIPYFKLTTFKDNIHNVKQTPFKIYKVKSGDNLRKIGKMFNIKYSIIKKFNNLKSNLLSINQKLIIPKEKNVVKYN